MVMQTKSAGAGSFADFDLSRVESPAFVIDRAKLEKNLQILKALGAASNIRILAALKAFSLWSAAPLISRYLDGVCASGLYEARLAHRHYQHIISCFSPAYRQQDIEELVDICDHMIFNSIGQLDRFGDNVRLAGKQLALRLNPETPLGKVEKYDPSSKGSRLGVPISTLDMSVLDRIDGLHVHNLCEQGLGELSQTIEAIIPVLEQAKGRISWLNLGGGHMITAPDYDRQGLVELLLSVSERFDVSVFLEPGTAIAFDAGILVGEVLDITNNDGVNAVLDISATCHMPDVLEAPYRPALLGERADGVGVRLGGPSCLAGDVIGDYRLAACVKIGDRLAFLDQAHYSMVKTTMFNGVPLPAIYLWDSQTDALELVRSFDYSDFESRLS